MPLIDPIQVTGWREASRALRRVDSDAPKALRLAANEGAQLVVDLTRRRMPRRTGRAGSTVKVRSTRTAARVVAGGKRAPYYPWLDYGGTVGRGKKTVRKFESDGRYLYPSFYAVRDQVYATLERELSAVVAAAGLTEG